MTMLLIAMINGPDGLQSQIHLSENVQYVVTFHDTDAGQRLPTCQLTPCRETAFAVAREFVALVDTYHAWDCAGDDYDDYLASVEELAEAERAACADYVGGSRE